MVKADRGRVARGIVAVKLPGQVEVGPDHRKADTLAKTAAQPHIDVRLTVHADWSGGVQPVPREMAVEARVLARDRRQHALQEPDRRHR